MRLIFKQSNCLLLLNPFSVESILFNPNCILEAFGNAKALRNLNSSRFGKYIELYYGGNNKLQKKNFADDLIASATPDEKPFFAVIHNYMLEKVW